MQGAKTLYCEQCGQKISGTARFCRFCGVRQRAMPEEEFFRDVSRAENPIIKTAPKAQLLPSITPKEEYYQGEAFSRAENHSVYAKSTAKHSLLIRVAAILLVGLFIIFAYGAISTVVYKPAGETTKVVNMSLKKSDWAFQDFFKGTFLSKLTDFIGLDNVSSIFIVICGLTCLTYLIWFYYSHEYW